MRPWRHDWSGRLEELTIDSTALRGNPLGDAHERPLLVYTPPGYTGTSDHYPCVYVIQGYTGSVGAWQNRVAFRPTFPEALDLMMAADGAPKAIVVFVDAWTAYGGSQYLDSPATGRYHTYLCEDVVSFVDGRYRTVAAPGHRGIVGKSSGGYGAMVTPMLRPDVFGGLATHAGDALFEACYIPMFPAAARALRDHHGGSYEAFWTDFRSRVPGTKATDFQLAEAYGYAAAYSADADGTVRLPFDLATGRLLDDVWARWLDLDPVRMVPRYADALRSLRAVWIDAGTRDEYHLDLGATAFRDALAGIGVTDVHFELFDATHAQIEYRYPLAVRYLAERLRV